ncbi:hypothetical protein CIB48_g3184 [Xylaria polymorpha]|nr:hypothetical protein CIB48_g3184 [Xylaria polymorpha]
MELAASGPATTIAVPEPRIRTIVDGALVFSAERCRRHDPYTAPILTARVAATVVPDPTASAQDFRHAALRRAGMEAAVPASLYGRFIAVPPLTYVPSTPVLARSPLSKTGWSATLVFFAVIVSRLCFEVAGTTFVCETVQGASSSYIVALVGSAVVAFAVCAVWKVPAMTVSYFAMRIFILVLSDSRILLIAGVFGSEHTGTVAFLTFTRRRIAVRLTPEA